MAVYLFHGSLKSDANSLVGMIADGVPDNPPWKKVVRAAPDVEWHHAYQVMGKPGDRRGVLLSEEAMKARAQLAAKQLRHTRDRRRLLQNRRAPGYIARGRVIDFNLAKPQSAL